MPQIDHITLPSGTTYEIVDAVARSTASGAIIIKGATTTALTDNATTNPITVNGNSYTAVANDAVFYNNKEFVFDGTKWHEFGDMTGLGSLATKNSASGQFTPHGSVSQPTFTGNSMTSTGTVELSGAIDITNATNYITTPYVDSSGTYAESLEVTVHNNGSITINGNVARGIDSYDFKFSDASHTFSLPAGSYKLSIGRTKGFNNPTSIRLYKSDGTSIASATASSTSHTASFTLASATNCYAYFHINNISASVIYNNETFYPAIYSGDSWFPETKFVSIPIEGTIDVNDASEAGTGYTPAGTIQVNASSGTGTAYTPEGSIAVNETSGTGTSYTPAGTIAVNASTGSGTAYTPEGSIAVNASSGTGTAYTPEGSIAVNASSGTGAAYTPEGSVSAPTISVATAGATTSIQTINSVGSLPALTMTVNNGNLTIGWDAGALPTKNTALSVKTGDASYSSSQPTFTGTQKKFAFIGTQKKLAFTGTQKKLAFTGTEKKLAFTGTQKKLAFSGTSKHLAFTGTTITPEIVPTPVEFELNGDTANISVTGTPTGTVSQPTFTGTQETVTVS